MENYIIDSTKVMHDLIDGEVVIVNLENGYYYSLDGVGAQVWQLLSTGHTKAQIHAQMATLYAGESSAEHVDAFIDRLQQETLITASETPTDVTPVELTAITYAPPSLQKFTDMDSLLLLDPIHEVEDSGWPHTN